jgi:GDPmannose 4,6-dehydratase
MIAMKKVLITGIGGQLGSYLADYLLELGGFEVHGIMRRTSNPLNANIKHIQNKVTIHRGDMSDGSSIRRIIGEVLPDYIVNLAAMSQVRDSYDTPAMTIDINCNGLVRIIESVRHLKLDCKIYQSSSSEMFGKVIETPQNEKTPFYPRSPYGVSKVAAHFIAKVYRESYGMKIYSGIFFNNESPRRGQEFLSRKVCMAVAAIANGGQDKLVLGNLDAKRDFGYSYEYARWIWAILQHPTPDDFVVATGETHSVKEFVMEAFKYVGIENWEDYCDYDKSLTRPAEVDLLLGDAGKSKKVLGFEPKVKFKELVGIMVESEMSKLRQPKYAFGV